MVTTEKIRTHVTAIHRALEAAGDHMEQLIFCIAELADENERLMKESKKRWDEDNRKEKE